MPRVRKFKSEEIIAKLREDKSEPAREMKIHEVCKQLGVTEQTFYRWKKEDGGLKMDQAKRLKELEKENARLKRLRRMLNWARPSCGGPPRETSEPGETAPGRDLRPQFAGPQGLGTTGLPRPGTDAIHAASPDAGSG